MMVIKHREVVGVYNLHLAFRSANSSGAGFDPTDLFRRHFAGFTNGSFADMFGFTDFGSEAVSLNIEVLHTNDY